MSGGEIVLDPDKAGYQKNNFVQVTAMPEEGFAVSAWSGDLTGAQNPTTLRVSGNHVVTAASSGAKTTRRPWAGRPTT